MTKRIFLEKVARMYYILEMSQQEIALNLGIGRSSVARHLKEAKEEGVIRFLVSSSSEKEAYDINLEKQIINNYKLMDTFILPSNEDSNFEMLISSYINSILPYQGIVGVGGGSTMNQLSLAMSSFDARPNLNIVQTIGGFANNEKMMPSTSTIQNWSTSLKSNAIFLPAPVIVENEKIKNVYLESKSIAEVYKLISQMNMFITGIGSLKDVQILEELEVDKEIIDRILDESVGDINLHFFNDRGEFIFPELSNQVLGVSIKDFFKIPKRVSVAFGKEKKNAIKAALKGDLTDILITTRETAELLI